MDKIIFGIENQIYETLVLCKNFFKEINLTTFFLVLAFLFILFIRKWAFKKILSCFLTLFFLLIFYVRLAGFLNTVLDAETKTFVMPILGTISIIIAAVVFIYHAAIKQ